MLSQPPTESISTAGVAKPWQKTVGVAPSARAASVNLLNARLHRVPMSPTVWIIVPVFNRFRYLKRLYEQVAAQTYPYCRLVIVDHGDRAIPESHRTEAAKYVRGTPADWWSGAVNKGISFIERTYQVPDTDYILLQNDDVVFDQNLTKGLLDIALSGFDVVGAVTVDHQSKRVLVASARLSKMRARHVFDYRNVKVECLPDGPITTEIQMGRGVVYPMSVIRRVGRFNERLRYRADPEYAYRAFLIGYHSVVTTSAQVSTVKDSHMSFKDITGFRDFYRYLSSPRSTGNLPDAITYFRSVLKGGWPVYCLLVHGTRLLGFGVVGLFLGVSRRVFVGNERA